MRRNTVDRRARQAVVIEDGPGVVKGDRLVAIALAEMPEIGAVVFHEALMPYVLLLDARSDERKAVQALRRARKSRERRSDGRIEIKDDTAVINAQSLAARACITAMAALEAFAAEVLPADASFTPTKGRRAGTRLDRDGILWLDAKTRFGDALPSVLGVESIKGTQGLWGDFTRILELRNAAIHPKPDHLHTQGRLDPELLSSRILAEDFVGVATMAEQVMERYMPGYVSTMDDRR